MNLNLPKMRSIIFENEFGSGNFNLQPNTYQQLHSHKPLAPANSTNTTNYLLCKNYLLALSVTTKTH